MSRYFAFDELTWLEVKALPRDTPLIIPLGSGYPDGLLSEALSHATIIGMLPSIPFGWPGSSLHVADKLLAKLVTNLVASLRDDGFTRACALIPQGIDLEMGCAQIALPVSRTLNRQQRMPVDKDRNKVIIIPIGHTEQHGYHLPLSTDTLIVEALCKGIELSSPDHAFTLPVMPYGVSTHRKSFAGTLNSGGRAFEDFWIGVIDVLVTRGIERFYFISGHGGNCSFLVNVTKYAGERHRRIFCATAWLYLSGKKGIAALREHRRSPIGGMGHAGELETSLMLTIRPDLVQMEKAVDETDFITTPSYYMDWVEGGALSANPPWDDDTATGAYGAGSLASSKNGKLWLDAAIEEKVGHIDEIHEQHARREQRRNAGYGLWGL